ncbi:MAG: outer membrane lipoprotein carrier protein LolA [Lentisphaerae bacterium]|nr:outer membrane lipoprotein carrier protein LolA [Lentisphaerota bacterium]
MRKYLTVLLWLFILLFPGTMPAVENITGIEAEFTQTRQLKDLDMSVSFRGFMRCEPGKRLKWAVREPVAAVTLIEADKLTHFDLQSRTTAVVDAGKIPLLKLMNRNLNGWMTGDEKILAENFTVSRPDARTLQLTPHDSVSRAMMSAVQITFGEHAREVKQIRITEKSGEITEISFSAVKFNPRWSEADWKLDLK